MSRRCPVASRHPSPAVPGPFTDPAQELAARLRHLADEIERGAVARVRVTVIRPGGYIERLGEIPDVIPLD